MSKWCVDNMPLFIKWHIHQLFLCSFNTHTHSIYPQHFHWTVLIQAIWLPLEMLYFLQINIYSWRERNAHFERFSRRPEYLPADLTTTTREQSAYMNINLRRVNEHYTYNAWSVEWSWPVSHQCFSLSLSLTGPYKPHQEILISIADDSWRKWIDWINGRCREAICSLSVPCGFFPACFVPSMHFPTGLT